MHILLIFLDGIGLGDDKPDINPFAAANTPTLQALAGNQRWLRSTPRTETARATFIPTDPRLGVAGKPQSGSGQAVIMTGRNVPAEIGEHYGPWPNEPIRAILAEDSLYKHLAARGKRGAYLCAYPTGFHQAVESGKRLGSSLQQSAYVAGVPVPTQADLYAGKALSADFTGHGWKEFLGLEDVPILTREAAGVRLAELARSYDFSLFSTWVTDEIGHRGPFERGVAYLELFDAVMASLLEVWTDEDGLIVITSDHGNMEDLSTRHHTENDVPTVIIGEPALRHAFAHQFATLQDITPRILRLLSLSANPS